ncbi:chitinase domain-containing protein [Anaeramoeba flamelloides]|uniref:Chitinase domain-containing protein n=1 Tax=Anaeramoeba flamelloides TaxID=1746091 RepID=A0ABQ8X697_9EUKA|nr:chitinase domain-containing protein [Anaeramoeba flamelloides]
MNTKFNLLIFFLVLSLSFLVENKQNSKGHTPKPVDTPPEERGLLRKKLSNGKFINNAYKYHSDTSKKNPQIETFVSIDTNSPNSLEYIKLFHQKINYLSPNWYSLDVTYNGIQVQETNYDESWLQEFRELNTDIILLPLFQLKQTQFFKTKSTVKSCIDQILKECLSKNYKGMVLEGLSYWDFLLVPEKVDFIIQLCDELHKNGLILVLPAHTHGGLTEKQLKLFAKVVEKVDKIHLKTNEFEPMLAHMGLSPAFWIKDSLNYFINNDVPPKKIFMGVHFKAKILHENWSKNKLISSQKAVRLLKRKKGQLHWEAYPEEHYFDFAKQNKKITKVRLSTLTSLKARIEIAKNMNVGISLIDIEQALPTYFDLI